MSKVEMNMKQKIVTYILILFFPYFSFSQNEITKDEIYSFIRYIDVNRGHVENSFDSTVVVFIDSLKVARIDTIGIFSYSSHGGFLSDSKKKCRSPWTVYIHWIKNGKTYHQKIEKNCKYESILIENSDLISYYIQKKSLIDIQILCQ